MRDLWKHIKPSRNHWKSWNFCDGWIWYYSFFVNQIVTRVSNRIRTCKLWHVFLAGFQPAILRVKGGRNNHSTTGTRLVNMALSARSISLKARYDVVFEGQEKALKAFAISAQFWFYYQLVLHSLSRVTIWTNVNFNAILTVHVLYYRRAQFTICFIADYWIKIKLTHKLFITAEDMAIAKWWLCIVIFPGEKTIIPTVAVPWFYIQIS